MSVLLIFLATVRAGDCVRLDHSDPAVLDNDGDCHYQPEDCNDVPGEGEAIYPGAVERCNGINDRCADLNGDGRADPGEVDPCEDGDGDGWKSCPGEPCLEPDGHTWSERLDCDEQNAEVHPDATERPNRRDDNCDGRVDEGTDWEDADGDGYGVRLPDGSPGDCDDGDPARSPALPEQPGDGVDNDCDGAIDRADSDLQEAEAPAPPVDYGCGGSASLLFLPLLFFVPRRRSVWLLLLGCIPLTTHARDPVAAEAFVRNGLRECGDAHLALMKEAVVHADLAWLNQQPTLAAAPITMEEVDQARDLLRRVRGEQAQAMEELYQLADQTDEALAGVPDLDPEIRAFWEKLYFEIQRAELANAADMLRTCRQAWPAGDRFTLADTVNGVWSLEQALLAAEAAYGESLKRGLLVTGDAGPALAPRWIATWASPSPWPQTRCTHSTGKRAQHLSLPGTTRRQETFCAKPPRSR
ncbi:MAG TPA: MopE-related protein [Myxococcota bacterium]|nr:MopE-related protein [Myxococcota bacterium]HND30918.1 MopE-related protein [Myxococcota bacterium]